ncbi:hypothetical protein [Streptomyces sp. WMMB 322]|uniref:hypothetical protein n=1 Tax=Streptomyces sp. WMMB 322 TaxID=1286821 RepID=UPI000823D6E0|nr:hypothetical protein [Streptomyces sp. WMMB 322]SCK57270.1 hypothetical protein H180DRAFT_05368 [Streptomyces sp. WMMB 322]
MSGADAGEAMNSGAGQMSQEVHTQVVAALGHTDTPVAVGLVTPGTDARRVPKRLRPKPRVAGKERKQRPPWWGWLVLVFIWLTDVPQTLYDLIADSITLRRKRRPLRGGWRSQAGGLLAACDAPARTYLVVGRSGLHLVYVGDLGSEAGWSLPLEHVRDAEPLKWADDSPYVANSRLHFTDGSWSSVRLKGGAQQQILGKLAPPPGFKG